METIKSTFFLVILSFATTFSQPLFLTHRSVEGLQNELNLSESQKEKIETILMHKKDNLDRIRNKMITIMENLKDSTEYVSSETDKEILKVLNKEQAEKYGAETERYNQFAIMPPPGMMGDGFSIDMMNPKRVVFNQFERGGRPGHLVIGMFDQGQCETGCMDDQEDTSGADFQDQNFPDSDDTDLLQDLDIFDLMDIL